MIHARGRRRFARRFDDAFVLTRDVPMPLCLRRKDDEDLSDKRRRKFSPTSCASSLKRRLGAQSIFSHSFIRIRYYNASPFVDASPSSSSLSLSQSFFEKEEPLPRPSHLPTDISFQSAELLLTLCTGPHTLTRPRGILCPCASLLIHGQCPFHL